MSELDPAPALPAIIDLRLVRTRDGMWRAQLGRRPVLPDRRSPEEILEELATIGLAEVLPRPRDLGEFTGGGDEAALAGVDVLAPSEREGGVVVLGARRVGRVETGVRYAIETFVSTVRRPDGSTRARAILAHLREDGTTRPTMSIRMWPSHAERVARNLARAARLADELEELFRPRSSP